MLPCTCKHRVVSCRLAARLLKDETDAGVLRCHSAAAPEMLRSRCLYAGYSRDSSQASIRTGRDADRGRLSRYRIAKQRSMDALVGE